VKPPLKNFGKFSPHLVSTPSVVGRGVFGYNNLNIFSIFFVFPMAIQSKMTSPFFSQKPEESRPSCQKGRYLVFFILVVVLTAIAGGLGWFVSRFPSDTITLNSDYQAVFLDNGQVYFGKITQQRTEYLYLTQVFYLQSGVSALDAEANIALVKLGNEMHGPKDEMFISNDRILFVENLKDDSKVVQAILQYQSK